MINDVENNAGSLNEMSDLEFDKNSVEMMRYRPNGLSYKLGFGGIAFSLLGAFICLNSFNPQTAITILKILLNIAILLVGFLCCEQAKAYSKKGSLTLVVIGGVCIARMFWIPLQLMINFGGYITAFNARKAVNPESTEYANFTAEMAKYSSSLGKTITTGYEGGQATAWYTSNGYVRGVLAMVFLAIAAAFFITAGVIGYIRAKKLHTYLESINAKL